MANTAQAEVRIKPLSSNAFVAFFQKIGRWWLGVWHSFADKHPKLSKIIYMVFFFIVFSEGVTIWQYLVMLFLPYLFGTGLAGVEFIWPAVNLGIKDHPELVWAIFNEPMIDAAGKITTDASLAVIGGGLGNFLAFEIAVFTAQCINFPLQRNITFRSHGNPWYQAMWYFIGWVLISLFVNGVYGIVNPFLILWGWPKAIKDLLKTVITGGISMAIFFFIFMVIFPDYKKMVQNQNKKVENLKARNADKAAIEKAEALAEKYQKAYALNDAEKNAFAAGNIANAKAVAWDFQVRKLEKLKAKNASKEEIEATEKAIEAKYAEALEAAEKRDAAEEAFAAIKNAQ